MAVKWIVDAARDIGIPTLDAVELLASKQNYPMNGLLDEDRVQFLKRYRGDRKTAEESGKRAMEATERFDRHKVPPVTPPAPAPVPVSKVEATSVTVTLPSPVFPPDQRVRDDEKTQAIPPPPPAPRKRS